MKRPLPHLPAAVIEDQAASVARVVPAAAKLVRVGDAKVGYFHKAARSSRRASVDQLRVAEIERLIEHRYGPAGVLTDGEGEIFIHAIAPHLFAPPVPHEGPNRVLVDDNMVRLIRWATRFCRKALEELQIDGLQAVADADHRPLKADVIGARVRLTRAERSALSIQTIGAIDWTKRQRLSERREAHKQRQRERRQQEGAAPRAEAVSVRQPWIVEGYRTRRTWERHGKRPRVANSCATVSRVNVASSCATEMARSEANVANSCAVSNIPCGARTCDTPLAQAVDAVQFALFSEASDNSELRAVCEAWDAGPMPEAIRVAYVATKRRRAVRQEDVARAIEISRPQLANAIATTFNLSPAAVARLKGWLLADDGSLPTRPVEGGGESGRPARPHHRRGGKRAPDPGPPLPKLRLFTLVETSVKAETDERHHRALWAIAA